jgi:hypothetical protein
MSETRKPRRRWFQYSLRSLFLLTFLVSLGMSWFAVRMKRAREQGEAVEWIRKGGGSVVYDYQYEVPYSGPPGPVWLRNLLGTDFFATAVHVCFFPSSVSDAGLEHLKGLTQLRELDLRFSPVGDNGLKYLNGLARLRTLDLSDTNVTDAGSEHLKRMTHLQTLNLEDAQVTDAGLEHLKGLTQLKMLILLGTHVTDDGVNRLQKALPNCQVITERSCI